MTDHPFCQALTSQRTFFLTSISCFRPQDASFAPAPGVFTVANQIAHTAATVDWFMEGIFSPRGFDMDFAAHEVAARAISALEPAVGRFTASYDAAIARLAATPMAELQKPVAAGPILGGMPRLVVADCLADHTAHHRGALTVYARLLGLNPPMPYA